MSVKSESSLNRDSSADRYQNFRDLSQYQLHALFPSHWDPPPLDRFRYRSEAQRERKRAKDA
jgi:hypothetical protein